MPLSCYFFEHCRTALNPFSADGKGYAVNLKDSRLLKDNGIYCDDLYILIRRNYKDDEKNTQAHDDSIAVAEALVK